MNTDFIMLVGFALVLLILMIINRHKVKIEKILFPVVYMVLYRTKLGLAAMDKFGKKHEKLVQRLGVVGVVLGFLGMLLILVMLTLGVYKFLFANGPAPVGLLLPGTTPAPGLPSLSFLHWILAIFILAIVHEFSHGLLARAWDIKVKSSGFAVFSIFLPLIPAAFVEPDEKELMKSSKKAQLSVLAAGSFANFLTAAVFLLVFLFVLGPIGGNFVEEKGVVVTEVVTGYPAELSGLKVEELVVSVNDREINNPVDFIGSLEGIKEGDTFNVITEGNSYSIVAVEHPESPDKGYLGLNIVGQTGFIEGKETSGAVFSWISLLFFWVFTANLGVGLFNVLPMLWPLPLDGGKMFYIFALKLVKDNEEKARKIAFGMSLFCLLLIVASLGPLLIGFFKFIFNPIFSLII